MSDITDADLVRSILSGNKNDFSVLISRFQKEIFGYLFRFLHQNREAAEDIAQNVFLKVYQNLHRYDQSRPLRPWIYRLAHNEAVNFIRSESRKKESRLEDSQWDKMSSSSKNSEIELGDDQQRAILLEMVNRLKTKYREVIVLHYYENKSYEEIAEIIEANTSTVGTRLRRARNELRNKLEKLGIMISIVFSLVFSQAS